MKKSCFVLFLFGLIACNRNIELEFPDEINYFDREFVSFFPKEIPESYSKIIVSKDRNYSHPFVWLKIRKSKEELSMLVSELKSTALDIYSTEDTCLLVIDKHLDRTNWFKIGKIEKKNLDFVYNECCLDKLPVPNFYEDGWEETDKGLTGLVGYDMYVIDAQPGVFMDSTKLPNGKFTPQGWKHGFSKGVAINEEEGKIIYWADIW
jgi:hypothetical protein